MKHRIRKPYHASHLLLIVCLTLFLQLSRFSPATGFAPTIIRSSLLLSRPNNNNHYSSSTTTAPQPTAPSERSSSRLYVGWEDLVFSAESTASGLASNVFVGGDPTILTSSLPIMYGAGLLTSVSPCVWGLLPLTMSYISTAAGERKDKQALLPALAFAAGLASVFCGFGVVAATVGGVFGQASGVTGLVLGLGSSSVCLLMGLQLLELTNLPLLSFLTTTPSSPTKATDEPILIDAKGNMISSSKAPGGREEAGSLFRTFLLGGSSALVASPCATPVLTSILAYVSGAKSPVIGALLLGGYTLGYATPLLIVAASGGQALARAKEEAGSSSFYGKIAPWITPLTASVLLWYGTNGILTALFGDPSMIGLAPIIE